MAISANFPVASIGELASAIEKEKAHLEQQLAATRTAVQKDPNFRGSAADRYQQYMEEWDGAQKQLTDALEGAGRILRSLESELVNLNQRVLTSFGS